MNHAWTEPKRHPDCSEPCVSDLALDQLFCEELSDDDAQALKTRISACAGCQVRWDERSQGLKAFRNLTPMLWSPKFTLDWLRQVLFPSQRRRAGLPGSLE